MLDGFDDRLAVVIHAPKLEAVAMLVSIQQHISRLQPWRARIADAAQINGASPAHLPVERHMRMPDNHQVRLAACQPPFQLLIAVPRLETGSVVSARGRVNA